MLKAKPFIIMSVSLLGVTLVLLILEVRLWREGLFELTIITCRLLIIRGSVFIEGLLIASLKEFIMSLLIVSSELWPLPPFEVFLRLLIILVHVLMLCLLLFLTSSFLLLMAFVHSLNIVLTQSIAFGLRLQPCVCLLKLLELFLHENTWCLETLQRYL